MNKHLKRILITIPVVGIVTTASFFGVKYKDNINNWFNQGNISIDEHNRLLVDLTQKEEEINSLHVNMAKLKANFDELKTQLDILFENQTEHAEEISNIKTQLNTIQTQITTIETKISELETTIRNMQEQLANLHKGGVLVNAELEYGFTIANSNRELGSFNVLTHGGDLLIMADVTAKVESFTGLIQVYVDDKHIGGTWFDHSVGVINKFVHLVAKEIPAGTHVVKIIAETESTMEIMSYNRSMCTIIEL